LVNGDFLTTNNHLNASMLYGLLGMQKFFQEVWSWYCLVNGKQATQTGSLCPFVLLDPIQIRYNIFWISFASANAHFLHLFLSLVPHHVFGPGLGRYDNRYVKRINFYVKESPSISIDEKSISCSISIGHLASSFSFIALLSTYYSSS
jgi:hypothetical protein